MFNRRLNLACERIIRNRTERGCEGRSLSGNMANKGISWSIIAWSGLYFFSLSLFPFILSEEVILKTLFESFFALNYLWNTVSLFLPSCKSGLSGVKSLFVVLLDHVKHTTFLIYIVLIMVFVTVAIINLFLSPPFFQQSATSKALKLHVRVALFSSLRDKEWLLHRSKRCDR